ncbi:hypothetical protein KAU45_07365 [bacterium]|nr:hypothetical protein [bacterium]
MDSEIKYIVLDTNFLHQIGRHTECELWDTMYNKVKDSSYKLAIPGSYLPELGKLTDKAQRKQILETLDELSGGLLIKDPYVLSIYEMVKILYREEIGEDIDLDVSITCLLEEHDLYKKFINIKGLRIKDLIDYVDVLIAAWVMDDEAFAHREYAKKQQVKLIVKKKKPIIRYLFISYYYCLIKDILTLLDDKLTIKLPPDTMKKVVFKPIIEWNKYYESSYYTKAWIDLLDYHYRTDTEKHANINDRYDLEFNHSAITIASVMASDRRNINKLKQSKLLGKYNNPRTAHSPKQLIKILE